MQTISARYTWHLSNIIPNLKRMIGLVLGFMITNTTANKVEFSAASGPDYRIDIPDEYVTQPGLKEIIPQLESHQCGATFNTTNTIQFLKILHYEVETTVCRNSYHPYGDCNPTVMHPTVVEVFRGMYAAGNKTFEMCIDLFIQAKVSLWQQKHDDDEAKFNAEALQLFYIIAPILLSIGGCVGLFFYCRYDRQSQATSNTSTDYTAVEMTAEEKTATNSDRLQQLGISALDPQVPNYFICPIKHDIMNNPVTVDNLNYERTAIMRWILQGNYNNPIKPNQRIVNTIPVTNQKLQQEIDDFLTNLENKPILNKMN